VIAEEVWANRSGGGELSASLRGTGRSAGDAKGFFERVSAFRAFRRLRAAAFHAPQHNGGLVSRIRQSMAERVARGVRTEAN
jgi:hypothetical protein